MTFAGIPASWSMAHAASAAITPSPDEPGVYYIAGQTWAVRGEGAGDGGAGRGASRSTAPALLAHPIPSRALLPAPPRPFP